MSTTVDFSTEQAVRELAKAEPAGHVGLMKPPLPGVESAGKVSTIVLSQAAAVGRSNTRVTLFNQARELGQGGAARKMSPRGDTSSRRPRLVQPVFALKRDIARRHSGGYQGSHPPQTAIENLATALPAQLRAY